MIRSRAACTATAALLAGGMAACMANGEPRGEPAKPNPEAAVFALLADRTLVALSPSSDRILLRRPLGPESPIASMGHFLALSADGRRLFVLMPAAPSSTQDVAIVETDALHVVERLRLERGIIFRVIAVGPRSGRLYLFGNRPARAGAEDAVVTVLDPRTRETRTSTIREAGGHDWWIFDAAVTDDESRLYVSYHGGCNEDVDLCTTGADWIEVRGDRLVRCGRRSFPGVGCLTLVHGRIHPLGGAILAATGGPRLVEISRAGAVTARLQARLPRNHVMEFALDADGERAFAVGQCDVPVGGVTVIDLASGRTRVLTRAVCGERNAVGGDLVAVAEQYGASPLGAPARIALIDARTGSTRHVDLPIETVDVLIVPPT